jgi:hypothetical protein
MLNYKGFVLAAFSKNKMSKAWIIDRPENFFLWNLYSLHCETSFNYALDEYDWFIDKIQSYKVLLTTIWICCKR